MIIGIMGAMPDEVDQLCAKLENVTVEPYGGVEYHRGTLAGKQVVVCCAGMGKANAAATTQVLITRYGAEKIIFSGIAGNMTSKIGIGDVVILPAMPEKMIFSAPNFVMSTCVVAAALALPMPAQHTTTCLPASVPLW